MHSQHQRLHCHHLHLIHLLVLPFLIQPQQIRRNDNKLNDLNRLVFRWAGSCRDGLRLYYYAQSHPGYFALEYFSSSSKRPASPISRRGSKEFMLCFSFLNNLEPRQTSPRVDGCLMRGGEGIIYEETPGWRGRQVEEGRGQWFISANSVVWW